jgi:3-oxoacyl-(acyl-carrier-protein) synthase
VVAVRSLETGTLVPNAGVAQVDPALDVDVVLTARTAPHLDWVLSCGYAFGGLNSALVLGRAA